jgi:hypothetical protein
LRSRIRDLRFAHAMLWVLEGNECSIGNGRDAGRAERTIGGLDHRATHLAPGQG